MPLSSSLSGINTRGTTQEVGNVFIVIPFSIPLRYTNEVYVQSRRHGAERVNNTVFRENCKSQVRERARIAV